MDFKHQNEKIGCGLFKSTIWLSFGEDTGIREELTTIVMVWTK